MDVNLTVINYLSRVLLLRKKKRKKKRNKFWSKKATPSLSSHSHSAHMLRVNVFTTEETKENKAWMKG